MTTSPWMRAPYEWRTLEASSPSVEVVAGAQQIHALRIEFQQWADQRRLPTTATSCWLFPAVGNDDRAHPWAVVARNPDGALEGLVVLLDEVIDGQTVTCLAGTDQGNRGVLPAETPELAEELGRAVADALVTRVNGHRVLLGPLDAEDPCVHAFASALPNAQLIAADPIPVIRQVSPEARSYLSQGMRRTLRKAKNRLAKDGRQTTVRYTKDASEIFAVIPQLERVHRDRDHVHGRPS
ncbi:MAG TPA: hypothetical protein VMT88_01580, partial [Actinomycetes bacterium]|nr:hypothetical protein [Actinomycetes bacterium]